MQIAKIVPKVKTKNDGIFDYAIPAEILPFVKVGSLVEVPFGYKKVQGIILELKKSSKIAKLKNITRVISSEPMINEIHVRLAHWLSRYYFTSFGKCLFENLVPPAKRLAKKNEFTPTNTLEYLLKKQPVKVLLVADFKARLSFYQKAITETQKNGQQVIILVPDLSNISLFQNIAKNADIIHANLTLTQRYTVWRKINHDKDNLIIGSVSALFAPVKNLGLIIIDQEENEAYKNDREPRFHALQVAEKISELTGANLVAGSLCPRVETYQKVINKKYLLRKQENRNNFQNTIVDMNFEKSILSQTLKDKIEENLKNNQKTVLVLNRKGEGTKFTCQNCDWIARCKTCNLPLTPLEDELFCSHCDKNYSKNTICPICQSIDLKSFGLATAKLEKIIKKNWPDARTIIFEKHNEKINKEKTEDNWQIAVVTSYALKLNLGKVGLVTIIDADSALNIPGFNSLEKSFANFYKFLRIAKNGIIQTKSPDSIFIKTLSNLDYFSFAKEELNSREKNGFPPFKKLVRLVYKHQDEVKLKTEMQKVKDKITSKTNESGNLKVYGPSKLFINKKLGYFRGQIIIKTDQKENLEIFTDTFRELPTGWSIDIDPIEIT